MKSIKLFILSLMVISISSCHSSSEITQSDLAAHKVATELLKDQKFMIKANRITLNNRPINSVSDATNFITVDGDKAVVQLSPAYGGGPNGVGGFTVNGTVTGYQVNTRDNGDINLKFNVQAPVGSCHVSVNLLKDGNVANVYINNMLKGSNATMNGSVSQIDNSIFKGRSHF